jgi:adenylate cyclase
LGRDILDRAIADERTLSLQRVERCVMFLDIRGFTAWSETQTPEAVAGLLNACYRAAETALVDARPIKVKYTADEVMAVFAEAPQAVWLLRCACWLPPARCWSRKAWGAGAGVHGGPLMEGVLGGDSARAYDFIGDTVNTAQRLCDAAAAGELLVSVSTCMAARQTFAVQRTVQVKGKRVAVPVAAVLPSA